MSRFNQIAECVWSFRDRASSWWPTPDQDDAVRFAFCEAAEAIDAVLRQKKAYMRNHARAMDVDEELAQCAIMLITALGREHQYGRVDGTLGPVGDIDEVARRVALVFVEKREGPCWWVWAEWALMAIADRVGGIEKLAALIDRELARVEARHMPEDLRHAVEVCARVSGKRSA